MNNAFTQFLTLSIALGGLIGSGNSGPIPTPEKADVIGSTVKGQSSSAAPPIASRDINAITADAKDGLAKVIQDLYAAIANATDGYYLENANDEPLITAKDINAVTTNATDGLADVIQGIFAAIADSKDHRTANATDGGNGGALDGSMGTTGRGGYN
ncbi:hypothetical protein PG997_006805 [Apiospora hydei]|uniref:Uncharacterized protein n=1 Tax=Apiospora hydei TaxID=1337664 RepID=A0ABR1WS49_9PEZI